MNPKTNERDHERHETDELRAHEKRAKKSGAKNDGRTVTMSYGKTSRLIGRD
jgi:hypothetical protein